MVPADVDRTLIVVDDDHKLRNLIAEYLESYGFTVHGLPDGEGLMATMQEHAPSLVILDIMLPGRDGLELLRDLRTRFTTPVIMLTAKGEDMDRIVGLELGADDYLGKPFNPRELLARIKAVLRRSSESQETEAPAEPMEITTANGLVLDINRQTLLAPSSGKGQEPLSISLSLTESRILMALMQRANRPVSRDTLMNLARGREFNALDRTIDVHVSRLRAKLAELACCKDAIRTVWGTGYMFADH